MLCFEKNPYFFRELDKNIRGPNVVFSEGNVLTAERFLQGHGVQPGTVDCIISTLPCSNLDYERVLKGSVIPWLKPGGLFVQYMHVLSYLKGFNVARLLSNYFSGIEADLVIMNIPPAIVYNCRHGMNASLRKDRDV